MTFTTDQPIVWRHVPRGGYGFAWPVDGTVVRVARRHVIIRVRLRDGRLVERLVRPENLRVRGENQ